MSSRRLGALAAITLLTLVGCGAGADGGTPPTGPATSPSTTTTSAPTTTPPIVPTAPTAPPPSTTTPPTTPPTTAPPTTTRAPVRRTLTFTDRTVRFERPFRLRLAARVTPAAPVAYRLVPGAGNNDDQCRVAGDRLTIGDPPTLPVTCAVEARVQPGDGTTPPPPRIARITVSRASFRVEVAPIGTVDWSEQGSDHVVPVTMTEASGDAYSVALESADERCAVSAVTPAAPRPGTTRYTARVTVADPGAEQYSCTLHAYAGPLDINDGPARDVTLTVVP